MPNAIPMQLLVASDATSADLHILGNITHGHWLWGKEETDTDAVDVAKALADLPETCREITVHINSMGGEVAQGVAIYNALKGHGAHVTTVCEGFACSIASVIFMAGDTRIMRDASLLMIHNAWMQAVGSSADLRKAADDLETITELSKRAYMSCATDKLTREMLDELMDAETWILPEQAVEWGLATEVDGPDDDDEDDDGMPEQSAMRSLMRRLSEPQASVLTNETELEGFELSDETVERVAQAVAQVLAKQAAPANSGPEPDPAKATAPKTKSFMQRAALLFAE